MIERLFNIYMWIKKLWGKIRFKRKILAYKQKLNEKEKSWETKQDSGD